VYWGAILTKLGFSRWGGPLLGAASWGEKPPPRSGIHNGGPMGKGGGVGPGGGGGGGTGFRKNPVLFPKVPHPQKKKNFKKKKKTPTNIKRGLPFHGPGPQSVLTVRATTPRGFPKNFGTFGGCQGSPIPIIEGGKKRSRGPKKQPGCLGGGGGDPRWRFHAGGHTGTRGPKRWLAPQRGPPKKHTPQTPNSGGPHFKFLNSLKGFFCRKNLLLGASSPHTPPPTWFSGGG